MGALHFVDKPALTADGLREILFTQGLWSDPEALGNSLPFLMALREIRVRCRGKSENILILGETGTGKEFMGRYAHRHSGRSGELVTLGNVPETLIEDELFGHERGAFTGAAGVKQGLAERADGGTLYIDEFGDIPASCQVKLLRLLDRNTRETRRLGQTAQPRRVDLLAVMATNRVDILDSGDFRGDLLQRAKMTHPVILPPLRDRRVDISLLAEHFVRRYETIHGAERREITEEAMDALMAHEWPGNIRELDNTIDLAVLRFKGLRKLVPGHLGLTSSRPPASARADRVTTARGTGKGGGLPPEERSPEVVSADHDIVFQDLPAALDAVTLDHLQYESWAGKLPEIQEANNRLIARLVRVALEGTLRRSLDNKKGTVQIHPAMKALTGDAKLTASKAADLIKRLAGNSPVFVEWCDDPLLKEALEKAKTLRPSSGGRRRR